LAAVRAGLYLAFFESLGSYIDGIGLQRGPPPGGNGHPQDTHGRCFYQEGPTVSLYVQALPSRYLGSHHLLVGHLGIHMAGRRLYRSVCYGGSPIGLPIGTQIAQAIVNGVTIRRASCHLTADRPASWTAIQISAIASCKISISWRRKRWGQFSSGYAVRVARWRAISGCGLGLYSGELAARCLRT
jgi:hypothetical protein